MNKHIIAISLFLILYASSASAAPNMPFFKTSTFDANLFFANSLFTGKEKDSESGLYYYGARYYDSWKGQFVQADTMIPFTFST
jgi:RHS repeat-associated protein